MTLLSTQAKQIQRLHARQISPYRQIAASVGCSPATAYRCASDPKRATSERAKPIRASKLQSVDRDAFLQLLLSSRSNSEVVARMLYEFQEYGLPQGFTVSARTVRRFIRATLLHMPSDLSRFRSETLITNPALRVGLISSSTKFQFAGDDFSDQRVLSLRSGFPVVPQSLCPRVSRHEAGVCLGSGVPVDIASDADARAQFSWITTAAL